MSTQRGEHWQRYILPHIEQYTEQRSFLEGFRDGSKGSLSFSGLGQAWFYGALKTLLSPSVPALLDMAKVDRPRFYYTEGVTDLDRADTMVRDSGWIGTAYILNVLILAFMYVYCARGVVQMGNTGFILAAICLLVVVITGPVGFAKYRLIMDPILCLLAGRGLNEQNHITNLHS